MTRTKLCDFFGACIALLLLICFLFVAVNGFFVTCSVEIFYSPDNNEHVVFEADKPLLTLAAMLIVPVCFLLLLRRRITKRVVLISVLATLILTNALALWWIYSAKAVPYADSKTVLNAVLEMARGNARALAQTDYFVKYPYQLGFVWYAELVSKLFGADALYPTLAVGNVLCLDAIYLALIAITRRLFSDTRVSFFTAILLLLCFQPAFLCTFLYGLYPGLALALWGCYFVIRFTKEDRLWLLLPAAALIACAIVLKQNHKVLLVANVIILLLYALRRKKPVALAGIACMLAAAFLLPGVVQRHYEDKAETEFGRGTPFTAWLVTGLSESSFCSGWFNSYPISIMPENGYDADAAAQQIRADVWERVQLFASRPRYFAVFMYHKLTSHWNEPAYQCIWSSAAGEHSGALSPFAESLSYGAGNRVLSAYFNVIDQVVYAGFVIALFLFLKHKERRTEARLLLPLTILGIFLYHALFEAKAQYALPPFLMMLPYTAYGWTTLLSRMTNKTEPKE